MICYWLDCEDPLEDEATTAAVVVRLRFTPLEPVPPVVVPDVVWVAAPDAVLSTLLRPLNKTVPYYFFYILGISIRGYNRRTASIVDKIIVY